MPPVSENEESLWRLVLPPAIWLIHLLSCYVTVALWCAHAGRAASLGTARWLALAYTVVALAAIARLAWLAWARYQRFGKRIEPQWDIPQSRHAFLGFAQLLLAVLSGFAVLYVGLPFGFVTTCH